MQAYLALVMHVAIRCWWPSRISYSFAELHRVRRVELLWLRTAAQHALVAIFMHREVMR